jgi:hypothetical protein
MFDCARRVGEELARVFKVPIERKLRSRAGVQSIARLFQLASASRLFAKVVFVLFA